MRQYRTIRNTRTGEIIVRRAAWCQSFWCQLRGLQFRASLPADEGLLFVNDSESRVGTAIHMMFVFFPIAVIWLDAAGTVVDKQLAKPWRPLYVPKKAAQYYLEALPETMEHVAIGDVLSFDEESP